MDDRKLTLIVVPHGDLETRTYEVPYGRLKLLLFGVGFIIVLFIVIASSWWMVASQAARVPGLEREVARLQTEQEKVVELARTLAEVEAQYERVRRLLGADGDEAGAAPLLPPLENGGSGGERPEAAGEGDARGALGTAGPGDEVASGPAPAMSWPLLEPGFVTQERAAGDGAHPGIDIAVPPDTYIRAVDEGVVRQAGEDEVYGRYVVLRHDGGYESLYGHASRLFVASGDSVERHEVIALSGSTGRSTAPHLHFEVRRNGTALDPLTLVSQP